MLIKGAKGASFMSDKVIDYIDANAWGIMGLSFIAWTVILQIMIWIARLNVLKFIVFVGTFALAMAFAGNDLVNFIGVPLAGYESYKSFIASPEADPNAFLMTDLTGAISTPTYILILSGLVMVITLWTSRKAKSVIKTSIDLGRQEEGEERFGSTLLARTLVRKSYNFSKTIRSRLPVRLQKSIEKQFDQSPFVEKQKQLGKAAPSFDLIRASVTLVVASTLIAFATSLKLPLSTTYVTFMVAMGTSLSDKAWGRESAVYRITGVISVIGGWFLTAILAFIASFIIAYAIHFGSFAALLVLLMIVGFLAYRTHILHRRKNLQETTVNTWDEGKYSGPRIADQCKEDVVDILERIKRIYDDTIEGISSDDYKKLSKTLKEVKHVNKDTKALKDNVSLTINNLEENSIETGHYYVQVLDYLREIAHSITFINKPSLEHVDNHGKSLLPSQTNDLRELSARMKILIQGISITIKTNDFNMILKSIDEQQKLLVFLDVIRKNQIKRIRMKEVGVRNSMLYLNLLAESKNLVLQLINLVKAQRDFSEFILKQSMV
jgi:hypothetical protein